MDPDVRRLARAARRLIEVITLLALLPLIGCALSVMIAIALLVMGKVPL